MSHNISGSSPDNFKFFSKIFRLQAWSRIWFILWTCPLFKIPSPFTIRICSKPIYIFNRMQFLVCRKNSISPIWGCWIPCFDNKKFIVLVRYFILVNIKTFLKNFPTRSFIFKKNFSNPKFFRQRVGVFIIRTNYKFTGRDMTISTISGWVSLRHPPNRITTPIIKGNNEITEKNLVKNTWAEG